MYEHLLSPTRIGTLSLRNRIAMAPMGVELVEADGAAVVLMWRGLGSDDYLGLGVPTIFVPAYGAFRQGQGHGPVLKSDSALENCSSFHAPGRNPCSICFPATFTVLD